MDGGASQIFGIAIKNEDDEGCAYILDDRKACSGARRPGSAYCEHHHARCHVAGGSAGEQRRLEEAEALALAVGGRRRRRPPRSPPDGFLRRMDSALRAFSRQTRSRIVPEAEQ